MTTHESKSGSARASAFAETHWTLILRAQGKSPGLCLDALDRLCRIYWYPLYAFVRRAGHDAATAQDLTQQFFERFVERNTLEQVDPSKGKFRSFLLASLKNFLSNERQKAAAEKRGGKCTIISLDEERPEDRYAAEPCHEQAPEKVFDRAWAMTIVTNALAQLKAEYTEDGKAELFDTIQACLSGERDGLPYAQVAAGLNMSEAAVKMAVVRLRRLFVQVLRAQVGQTVFGAEELDAELRYLFSALAS